MRVHLRATLRTIGLGLSIATLACSGDPVSGDLDPTPRLADLVVDAPGATGEGFGDPGRAVNGVRGGGPTTGSLDVYSLDYAARPHLVLAWEGRVVRDGPGPDLVVFENAFRTTGTSAYFMDPAIVAVSCDGATWIDLPHAYVAADPSRYSSSPDDWEGFAGITPVLLHAETNDVDPFDPIAAGGDAFDLATLPAGDPEADAIRAEGARFVRITSAAIVTNPETGMPYPRDPVGSGADIDGVYARWLEPAR